MDDAPGVTTGRLVAVGCLTTALGAASGAMIAVLLSTFVAFLTRAPKCADIPTCDWYVYAGWGALAGGISLPWLAIRALRRPKSDQSS
ncbi:MAG TPA: hypothetical protein VG916_00270 [Gemmatimonadaceae bacterium]|nr:hypothetical protein [Gemmatimonadaceae bacterium]